MSEVGIRAALGHDATRAWLRRIIGRGEVFAANPPTNDPTWLGRRALALSILDDVERAQPGAMAQLIQEAIDDARERERNAKDRDDDGYRGDEGPELSD